MKSIILHAFIVISFANTRLYSQTDQFNQSDINGQWIVNTKIINNAQATCFVCPEIIFNNGIGTIYLNGPVLHFTWEVQNNILMIDCLDEGCKRYFSNNTTFNLNLLYEKDNTAVLELTGSGNNRENNFKLVMRR